MTIGDSLTLVLACVPFVLLTLMLGYLYNRKCREARRLDRAHARATTQLEALGDTFAHTETTLAEVQEDNARLREESSRMATQCALADQAVQEAQHRIKQWEESKTTFLLHAEHAAKTAALSSATDISHKLLAEYKRETLQAAETTDKTFHATTQDLKEHIHLIAKSVTTMNTDLQKSQALVSHLHKALATPITSGHTSETILENTLKSFGLEEGRDYVRQCVLEDDGRAKRPDILLFLPGDTVLVIDSKSSTLMEKDSEEEKKKLTASLYRHLKDLSKKDYVTAVRKAAQTSKGYRAQHVTTFMFLTSDGLASHVNALDSELRQNALLNNILIGGPSSLWAAVYMANVRLRLHAQDQNQKFIISELELLLEAIATLTTYTETLGKSLKGAHHAYERLTRSLNARLLPRARNMVRLGVTEPTKKLDLVSDNILPLEVPPVKKDKLL